MLIEDNEIYDQQLRYMAGVQLAVGYRKALGARQRWIADAQIQAGYYAPLNDPEPTVTYGSGAYLVAQRNFQPVIMEQRVFW